MSRFFEEISKETNMVTYGLQQTMSVLESGALETILCWEGLQAYRVVLKNKETEVISTLYLYPNEVNDPKYYKDANTGAELESIE